MSTTSSVTAADISVSLTGGSLANNNVTTSPGQPDYANSIVDLRARHLLQDVTSDEAIAALPVGTPFYAGFDPTAPYLHVGNLIPLIVSLRLAKWGLKPIILFGGSTGGIGDPSGRNEERKNLLSRSEIEFNIARQTRKVQEIFERQGVTPLFVNNYDWTFDVSILDFLRDIGKHIPVNYMLAKDVVRTRLEGDGISFTEFSYMLLQAFDYLHLYKEFGCRLQLGGSDQWGNITAGLELIRRKIGHDHGAHALSCPLILDSEGKKFGKSVGGALWIDEEAMLPYDLHQYLLNTADVDVLRYLRIFTFLSEAELGDVEHEVATRPEQRAAQHLLADKLIEFIHGPVAVEMANKSAAALFGGSLSDLSLADILAIFKDVPSWQGSKADILGIPVIDLLAKSGAVASKGEARRLISQGGVYLNSVRLETEGMTIMPEHLIEDSVLVFRLGKKKFTVVHAV